MLKYITGRHGTFMFSDEWKHEEVAKALEPLIGKVESAGFVGNLDAERVKTVGSSMSLGLQSRPEDAEKITRAIRGY